MVLGEPFVPGAQAFLAETVAVEHPSLEKRYEQSPAAGSFSLFAMSPPQKIPVGVFYQLLTWRHRPVALDGGSLRKLQARDTIPM